MTHKSLARTVGLSALVATCGLGWGCGTDTVVAPADYSKLLWTLNVNYQAVTIANAPPYNTAQLEADPRSVDGTSLTGMAELSFSTADTTIRLTSEGLVQGSSITTGAGARVIVTGRYNDVTVVDTTFVQVTAPPTAELASVTFLPTPGDSAKYPVLTNSELGPNKVTAQPRSTAGTVMTWPVFYRSSNPHVVVIDRTTGNLSPKDTGTATFYASLYAYGVAKRDSLKVRIGIQLQNASTFRVKMAADGMTQTGVFEPASVIVGVGGAVLWKAADSTGITFDDPSTAKGFVLGTQAVVSGNIDPFFSGTSPLVSPTVAGRARKFTAPGTYTFRSSRFPDVTGTVIVVAE